MFMAEKNLGKGKSQAQFRRFFEAFHGKIVE